MRVVLDANGMRRLELETAKLVQEITADVYVSAHALVPVDTGELKASLRTEFPTWSRGRVWVDTDHWSYNEYGTERMSAQPFMRPALYRYRFPGG